MAIKALLIACGFLTLASLGSGALAGDVYVDGYYRNDGTYVDPHYRSAPDSSYNNNWSVTPNVNPYTGQQGLLSPTWNDRPPTSSYGGYGSGSSYGSGLNYGSGLKSGCTSSYSLGC